MQQKVPFVSLVFQHHFASLNMRFRFSSRCIYSPLSSRIHCPRRHLWSLLIFGHYFHDLMILPWSFTLSSSSTLSMSLFTLHCHHHCYLAIISPSGSLSCHHFPILFAMLSSSSALYCSETTHDKPGGWSAVPCDWVIKQGSSSPLEHDTKYIYIYFINKLPWKK